jgi:hypothetical protein
MLGTHALHFQPKIVLISETATMSRLLSHEEWQWLPLKHYSADTELGSQLTNSQKVQHQRFK